MRHMSQNYLDENGEPKVDQDILDAISNYVVENDADEK